MPNVIEKYYKCIETVLNFKLCLAFQYIAIKKCCIVFRIGEVFLMQVEEPIVAQEQRGERCIVPASLFQETTGI
jgi:hypothetical protein